MYKHLMTICNYDGVLKFSSSVCDRSWWHDQKQTDKQAEANNTN